MITNHFIVKGRVQGVYFRASTVDFCKNRGITGWVRNIESGEVEILASGTNQQLQLLRDWLQRGPVLAKVDSIEVTEVEGQEFNEFVKLPTALVHMQLETN